MKISKDIPAGNIKLIKAEGNKVHLDVELRDSTNEWFYWKFKVVFSKIGKYEFHFVSPNKIGTRGPAVSLDQGNSWNWQSQIEYTDTQNFQYECTSPGEEVWFCQGIPYLQNEFDAFANEFRTNSLFQLSTLCTSRKGRNVELITIKEGNPNFTILLTARHHAQEMMANYVLEGILRAILSDTGFAKEFRKHIAVIVVPFVDKDGVEDGDQGKGRTPHDHGRDYLDDENIYPETKAVRRIVITEKPAFILDLHCPWIRGGIYNETAYMVESADKRYSKEMARFGQILERESPSCVPYSRKHDIPFGKEWNTSTNFATGIGLKHFGQKQPFVIFAQTLEIPFANFEEKTITPQEMLLFGESIARSIYMYKKEIDIVQKQN
ncbi:MAG: hypothetical protein JXR78_17185 [Victivallales bacterium]|nr:hypothetical protein [Victivallales bacterium]